VLRIGSATDNDIVIAGPDVEPYHAELVVEPDGFVEKRVGERVVRAEVVADDDPVAAPLLAAIAGGDDASRLVYADQLEQLGYAARAWVIRDPRAAEHANLETVAKLLAAGRGIAWPRPELDWSELARLTPFPTRLVGGDGGWASPIEHWFAYLLLRHGPELGPLLGVRWHAALVHDVQHAWWREPFYAAAALAALLAFAPPASRDALAAWHAGFARAMSGLAFEPCVFCQESPHDGDCPVRRAYALELRPNDRVLASVVRRVATTNPIVTTRAYRDLMDQCFACHHIAGHRPDCTWLHAALIVAAAETS